MEEFNLRDIVGAPCLIQVIHKKGSNDKVYTNIASIMKLPKGMAAPQRTLDTVIFDIDESDISELKQLPEWIANTIKASESWQQRLSADKGGASFAEIDDDEEELPF